MKKRFTFLIFLFLPIISFGQVQMGFKGGYIYYWYTYPNDGNYEYVYDYSHNAFSVSVSLKQTSLQIFNLGYELEYTNRSFGVNSTMNGLGAGGNVYFNYTLGNLYLRIEPQFSFGTNVKFYFFPGVYFGTLLHSSLNGTKYSWTLGHTTGTIDSINGTAKGYYPAFEFGLLIGLGIEFPLYKNLDCVFQHNFKMNILPIASSWGSSKIKMLNLNFEFGLVYLFRKINAKSSE